MTPRWRASRWATAVALVATAALAFVVLATRSASAWTPQPVSESNAVGDATCLGCHGDKRTFEGTAHRLTTRYPSRGAIAGSFAHGSNVLRTTNDSVHFRMDADSSGFYESAVTGKGADTTTRTERIAIVAGSDRKGQSFLYWIGNRLYQLPVSYWKSLDTWIYSPGPEYVDGRVNFDRQIAPRCLECHATYIESMPDLSTVNRYAPHSAILGVTCERCHGSGAEHVARERSVLHLVRGPAIANPARMSRARKMDACAQCHGGLGTPTVPSFSYVAGRPLDAYLKLPASPPDAPVDVHGNQAALLAKSKCFRSSQMTCLTCHDVHQTQRDVAQLSGRCLTCHQEQSCGLFPQQGHALAGRCVNCHMPLQPSNLIVSALEGKQEHVEVRSHWIRVYPDSARH